MSFITILWSMLAGTALTLATVHALVWASDRRALANLAFAVVAVALASMAPLELRLMYAATPEAYAESVRWFHIPIFVADVGIVLFVWLYLGTGRAWLGWLVIALRFVIVVANFVLPGSFNFSNIATLEHVSFMGHEVSTVGQATVGSWQWLATASVILLTVFALDAAVKLWRTGDYEARRRAVVVGGGIVLFVLVAILNTQLVILGLLRAPILVSPPFLVTVIAMAVELSRDLLRAARLANELRDSELRLDLAASAAGLGIWVWQVPAGQVQTTDVARAVYALGDQPSVAFERWMGVVHPDDVSEVRRNLQQALTGGGEFAAEYRVRVPDGTIRWVTARGRSELDAAGKPVIMRGVVRDITARKHAQHETEGLRRDLAHAGRVTMLGQLSSALAHELNQPLGAILRNAEAADMMLRSPTPDLEELRAIIADIRKDDRRAGEVIDRLRTLLRRRSVEFKPVGMDGLVQDVITLVRGDAVARRIALELVTERALPPVAGDKVHLSQVLLNLIMNSMDALSESREGARRIVIETRSMNGMVEVGVTDSGPGLAPEVADRLFQPFVTTKPHGMGMGLAVSRTIIEAHGGKLWVARNAGRGGASFRFTVPLAEHGAS